MDEARDAVKNVIVVNEYSVNVGEWTIKLDDVLFEWLQSMDVNAKLALLESYNDWCRDIPNEVRSVIYGALVKETKIESMYKVS